VDVDDEECMYKKKTKYDKYFDLIFKVLLHDFNVEAVSKGDFVEVISIAGDVEFVEYDY
jgi:hypothetical protein